MLTRRKVRTQSCDVHPTPMGLGLTKDTASAQCPSEDCGGTKAYFYLVQIRSADEPMTAFFKVCIYCIASSAHD